MPTVERSHDKEDAATMVKWQYDDDVDRDLRRLLEPDGADDYNK